MGPLAQEEDEGSDEDAGRARGDRPNRISSGRFLPPAKIVVMSPLATLPPARGRSVGPRLAFCWLAVMTLASCSVDSRGLSGQQAGGQGGGVAATGGKGGATTVSGSGGVTTPGDGSGGRQDGEGGRGAGGGNGGAGARGTGGAPSTGGGGGTLAGTGGATSGSGGHASAGGSPADSMGGSGGDSATGGGGGGGGNGGSLVVATGGSAGGQGGQDASGGGNGNGGVDGGGGAAGAGGSPQPMCGPSTCMNGCCNGNECVTTRTTALCGKGGLACEACAKCFGCGAAGACEVDPTSPWRMVCVSAIVSATKTGGMPWDPAMSTTNPMSGLPDPVCELFLDQTMTPAAMTSVQMNTTTPTWNQAITPGSPPLTASRLMSQAMPWSIFVGDDDMTLPAETICRISPQFASADFAAGDVTLPTTQDCTSVTLHLTCAL